MLAKFCGMMMAFPSYKTLWAAVANLFCPCRPLQVAGTLSADCHYAKFRTLPAMDIRSGTYEARILRNGNSTQGLPPATAPQVSGKPGQGRCRFKTPSLA